MTYQLNGATSVSAGETTEISPAKIADLQICELIHDYTIKGLSFGVVCYKQTWTDIKIFSVSGALLLQISEMCD